MEGGRQHNGMHTPLQSQQFPPLLQQGGGHPPRLPLPLPHPSMGFSSRPSSFAVPLAGQKRNSRFSDSGGFAKLFVASLPRNITEEEVILYHNRSWKLVVNDDACGGRESCSGTNDDCLKVAPQLECSLCT